MKRHLMLTAAVLLFSTLALAAEPPDQSRQFEQLLADVRAVLPEGWAVSAWPLDAEEIKIMPKPDAPTLVISRERKAHGYYGINAPALAQPEPIGVAFRFTCMPYLSDAEYRQATEENSAKWKSREAARMRLRGIKYGFMGGDIPPSAYEPANDVERKQLLEYALLWCNTVPRPLPDCYYSSLAFSGHTMQNFIFTEPDEQKEIALVRTRLGQIMKPYR